MLNAQNANTVGYSVFYFLSVNATFIPSPIKVSPQTLFMYVDTFLLAFNLLKIAEANIANTKHQIVPVAIKVV
ncbi:MAG TPA: hypothetical protein VEX65_10530, partial [Flavisolibacter sp.]|nr:hypothetical protein [Flavisolibacter sp.]